MMLMSMMLMLMMLMSMMLTVFEPWQVTLEKTSNASGSRIHCLLHPTLPCGRRSNRTAVSIVQSFEMRRPLYANA